MSKNPGILSLVELLVADFEETGAEDKVVTGASVPEVPVTGVMSCVSDTGLMKSVGNGE
jgi:hypothetical protein